MLKQHKNQCKYVTSMQTPVKYPHKILKKNQFFIYAWILDKVAGMQEKVYTSDLPSGPIYPGARISLPNVQDWHWFFTLVLPLIHPHLTVWLHLYINIFIFIFLYLYVFICYISYIYNLRYTSLRQHIFYISIYILYT